MAAVSTVRSASSKKDIRNRGSVIVESLFSFVLLGSLAYLVFFTGILAVRYMQLSNVAHAHFTIGRAKIAKSLFPPEIQKPDGFVLRCPALWR